MTDRRTIAMNLWQAAFGMAEFAMDCFGNWIHRDDFEDRQTLRVCPSMGNKVSHCGWTITHIRPATTYRRSQDADFFNNYEPMHLDSAMIKNDYYPTFKINQIEYQVIKCPISQMKGNQGYAIIKKNTGERLDWKKVFNGKINISKSENNP